MECQDVCKRWIQDGSPNLTPPSVPSQGILQRCSPASDASAPADHTSGDGQYLVGTRLLRTRLFLTHASKWSVRNTSCFRVSQQYCIRYGSRAGQKAQKVRAVVLFQRTQAQSPGPTWQLTDACTSQFWGSTSGLSGHQA